MRKIIYTGLWLSISLIANVQAERYAGVVNYVDMITLGTSVSGRVQNIYVQPGDIVQAGQTLIELERTPYQARYDQYYAQWQLIKAEQAQAQRDLAHAKELYDRAVLSTVSLQDAQYKLQKNQAQEAQIKARLAVAAHELRECMITAPYQGRVLDLQVSTQQMVINALQAQKLLTLVAAHKYAVRVQLPLAMAKRLRNGSKAQVHIEQERYAAEVRIASLHGRPLQDNDKAQGQVYYPIDIQFISAKKSYWQGQRASVELFVAGE